MNEEFKKRFLSSIIIVPLSLFVILKGSLYFSFFLIILFFISIYELNKLIKFFFTKIIGFIFLIYSFYSAFKIRNEIDDIGLCLFLFLVLVCVSTDMGGYIFGKLFKGPKLTKISPNKTYSGLFGSYLFSIIFCHFFIIFYTNFYYNSVYVYLLIIFLSTISQLGDLIISYFKRKSKIKDTGKFIPGHGGLLDRIDGMIFVFPIFYILYSIIL